MFLPNFKHVINSNKHWKKLHHLQPYLKTIPTHLNPFNADGQPAPRAPRLGLDAFGVLRSFGELGRQRMEVTPGRAADLRPVRRLHLWVSFFGGVFFGEKRKKMPCWKKVWKTSLWNTLLLEKSWNPSVGCQSIIQSGNSRTIRNAEQTTLKNIEKLREGCFWWIAGFAACSPKHLAPHRHREQCSTCQAEFPSLISPSISSSSHSISIISVIFQLQRKLRQFYSWRDLFPTTPPVTTGAFFTSFVCTELCFQRGPAKRPEKESNDVLVDVICDICHMTTESTSVSQLFVLLSLLPVNRIISTCFCQFLSQDFGPHQLELLMAGSQSMTFTSANPTVLQVALSRVGSKKDTILDITDITIGKNPKNRKL